MFVFGAFFPCFLQALRDIGMHHLRLLLIIGQLATVMLLPIWVVVDLRRILSDTELVMKSFMSSLLLTTKRKHKRASTGGLQLKGQYIVTMESEC